MVKNKKTIIIIGAAVIGALCLYSAGLLFFARKGVMDDIQNKAQLKSDTLTYLTEEHTSEEIENTLIDAFKQLDKEDNTQIIDALIYGTYNAAASVMMSDEETDILYQIMDEDKNFDLDLIEDQEIKDTIQVMVDQHVVPRYVNGNMFYDVDYGYFADTYGEYINEDYEEVLRFYDEEKKIDYVNAESVEMYPDVVTDRLDLLYNMIESHSDSEILDIMFQSYLFYECVYLGAYSQDYIFSDDAKIKDNVLESYKEYKEVTKDTELAEFLNTLVADYEESEGYRTVPIMESIKDFCGLNETESVATPSDATEVVEETEAALVVSPVEE